ncbi:cell-surface hemin receptor [Corynebacterium renale]|uniref:HtaA domain-containing protein n=1 Tax=Corynebacterium renale TaxID=1724 RepID=UPI000DA38C7F|nr:HtaA domain-containing protein [Corynebacterium renale]SQG63409.1 cell-surface hemin receptor [Corynebacterium renale]
MPALAQPRRHMRRAALAVVTTFALLPTTIAHADATTGALEWGLRPSFNSYTGGPTIIDEGATQPVTGTFSFPLKSHTYDAAENRVEAQFSGRVVYKQYCPTKEPATDPNCALDLTFKDPKVVIDDDGSYLEGTVSSKQYPKGGVFAPGKPVKVATLNTDAANYTNTNGTVKWENISSTLTQEGWKMFSEFYEVGEALAPVSFHYTGEGPGAARKTGLSVGEAWTSPGTYADVTRTFAYGDYIVAVVAEQGVALLDHTAKQIALKEAPITRDNVSAFNPATGVLYFAERNTPEIKSIDVVPAAAALGEPVTVGQAPGIVQALAVHPKTGKLSALSQKDDKSAYLSTLEGTQLRDQALPTTAELFDFPLQEQYSNAYTASFRNDDIQELAPVSDGTFLFNTNADVYAEGIDSTVKGTLLRLNPDATTPAEAAAVVPGTAEKESNRYYSALRTDGTTVVRYNNLDGAGSIFQVLTYDNGTLTPKTEAKPVAGVNTVADVTIKDGTIYALDSVNGNLVAIDSDLNATTLAQVPNGQRTNKPLHQSLLPAERGYYVATQDENGGSWRGGAFLLRHIINNDYVAPKPEEPKVEQPKPEQPKPEQPKPDQPKPEQPKADDKAKTPDVKKEPSQSSKDKTWSVSNILIAVFSALGLGGLIAAIAGALQFLGIR